MNNHVWGYEVLELLSGNVQICWDRGRLLDLCKPYENGQVMFVRGEILQISWRIPPPKIKKESRKWSKCFGVIFSACRFQGPNCVFHLPIFCSNKFLYPTFTADRHRSINFWCNWLAVALIPFADLPFWMPYLEVCFSYAWLSALDREPSVLEAVSSRVWSGHRWTACWMAMVGFQKILELQLTIWWENKIVYHQELATRTWEKSCRWIGICTNYINGKNWNQKTSGKVGLPENMGS